MQARVARLQGQQAELVKVCSHCGGGGGGVVEIEDSGILCQSLDCGVYFERVKTRNELRNMNALAASALQLLE